MQKPESHPQRLRELEALLDAELERLYRFARFRTGSTADAEDVVQEVLLRLFGEGADLSSVDRVRPYLYRCVANACTDLGRRRTVHPTESLDRLAPVSDRSAEDRALNEEIERIGTLLRALPAEQAEVIRLRTVDALSFVDIAALLRLPATTVKSRFKYGIEKLRKQLNA